MTGRTGNLRSDNKRYPKFIMSAPPSVLEEKRERIAEWLLLIWLRNSDPNILGLRRVDEEYGGRPLPMVHIAIPLQYTRKRLAQTLEISQLEDERKTPRVNLAASERWNKPHSYIRVHAAFIVARVLDAIKEQLMRQSAISYQTIQAPQRHDQSADRPLPNDRDGNRWLRSAVTEGLAKRNASIEPHQIQILTHRETGEKWVRILNVERGRRTTLRLAIKRAGITAWLALDDDSEGRDWSIRFAATETSKLLLQSSDSFDVYTEHEDLIEHPGTAPTVRLFSLATMADSLSAPGIRRPTTMALERTQSHAAAGTRSVS
jgi:hypothetical protein